MTLGSLSPKVLIYFGEDVLQKQHGEMGGAISHMPLAEPFLLSSFGASFPKLSTHGPVHSRMTPQ